MKDIQGYENKYAITSCGKVWSYKSKRFLIPHADKDGYLTVDLRKDGKRKAMKIHRLVAMAYIPNPEQKPQVNHLDENKQNNALNNLSWATGKENANYGNRNKKISEAHKRAWREVKPNVQNS